MLNFKLINNMRHIFVDKILERIEEYLNFDDMM